MGILTFAGPLLVLPFTNNLLWVTAVLVAGRCVAWLVYLCLCLKVVPSLRKNFVINRSMVKPLLRIGGWMTVSNIVSPFLAYVDRFLVGALLSATAVAYYATPMEVVTKLLLIPAALVGVLFPAFSTLLSENPARAARLYRVAQKSVFMVLFPAILVSVFFARDGLHIWLGEEFARQGFRVMQILAVGVFMNGLSLVAFSFVQGAGRPDMTAKFHLLEAVFYFPCFWLLTTRFGITGAATAWTLRIGVDALLLAYFAERYLAEKPVTWVVAVLGAFAVVVPLGLGFLTLPILLKIALCLVILGLFLPLAWRYLANEEEKDLIRNRLAGISP
jgi:O-antigen/teichoic acid export membrane protein